MGHFPRVVTAVIPGQETRFYLVDQQLDFIPEVKEWVDQKARKQRAPGTIKNFCYRLRWYYRFLNQRKLGVLEVKAPDLEDFSLWLSTPYRDGGTQPELLQVSTINQILTAVASLYKFLVRRRHLTESPVLYEAVSTRWGATEDGGARGTQRMELRQKEPQSTPKTVPPHEFAQFIARIYKGEHPATDPSGFRNRLFTFCLRESGLRCDELLGIRMVDLDFKEQGIHVRFRLDNENGARAKAGYGRDRFVHLPDELMGHLDTYITEVWLKANPGSDYLWLVLKRNAVNKDGQSTFGTALTKTAVNEMFSYYSERSGVKIHPHMLRHTHATDLVRSYLSNKEPVDWKFIADRLGHSSVETTMGTYVHLTQEDNKKIYQRYSMQREERDAKRRQGNVTRAAVEYNPADFPRPSARRSKPPTQQT